MFFVRIDRRIALPVYLILLAASVYIATLQSVSYTHLDVYKRQLSHETLSELSGLDPGELATLRVGLELAGAVRQLPGNRYMKLI